jgi:hypothetical protein
MTEYMSAQECARFVGAFPAEERESSTPMEIALRISCSLPAAIARVSCVWPGRRAGNINSNIVLAPSESSESVTRAEFRISSSARVREQWSSLSARRCCSPPSSSPRHAFCAGRSDAPREARQGPRDKWRFLPQTRETKQKASSLARSSRFWAGACARASQ